jgi:hypothetical protein
MMKQDASARLIYEAIQQLGRDADPAHLADRIRGLESGLTWNCRHLDNAEMKPIMRSVYAVHGYVSPEICTPLELMGD